MFTIQWPALYETKTLHFKKNVECSTRFGNAGGGKLMLQLQCKVQSRRCKVHHPIKLDSRPHCVIPGNIHTSPTEGIFFLRPPISLEIPITLHTFSLIFWALQNPYPPPQEIPIPSVRGGGGGRSMDIFCNCTL